MSAPCVRIVTLAPKPFRDDGSNPTVTRLAVFAAALVGCASPTAVPAREPVAIDVSEPAPPPASGTPLPGERVTEPPAPMAEGPVPTNDPERADLPASWVELKGKPVPFAEAMKKAREARDAFLGIEKVAAVSDPSAPDPAAKSWFIKAEALADRAERSYATAFHAVDATRDGKIDAMAEAGELDALFARRLDEMGLALLPPPWKSDPAVKATFEDVAQGPFKRWRDEARAIGKRCVEIAAETAVQTPAVKRCAIVRASGSLVAKSAKPAPAKSGSGSACPCAPGDPLCSSAIGGWCASPSRP